MTANCAVTSCRRRLTKASSTAVSLALPPRPRSADSEMAAETPPPAAEGSTASRLTRSALGSLRESFLSSSLSAAAEDDEEEEEEEEDEEEDDGAGGWGGKTSSKQAGSEASREHVPHLKEARPSAICSTQPRQKQWRHGNTTGRFGSAVQQKAQGRPANEPAAARGLLRAALIGAKPRRSGCALTSRRAACRSSRRFPSTTPTTVVDADTDADDAEEEEEEEEVVEEVPRTREEVAAASADDDLLTEPKPPPPLSSRKTPMAVVLTQPAKEAARRS
mmetsp:Transcript_227/g.402  ORF Transcript_227/g.402 Transcript_227/m.402 type:complete len:277 (+) Transcript_227:763-1593(+)